MNNDLNAAGVELVACPFCGGAPVLHEHTSHGHSAALKALIPGLPDHPGSWSIECCDVGMIKATRDEVISAWNRRAPYRDRDAAASAAAMTDMVDAAMVEMANITPPLRRSECERLIRAAMQHGAAAERVAALAAQGKEN